MDFILEAGALTESVTVTADTPILQTDTALRKTIESKDIEQLSFSGRNPIGVVGLKPGVVGGSFNNYNFSDLGNGGFSINGSRSDENNITVDGATAIRTRSHGAIVGIQNVDALQEVQVLTGDYMPEYGRASGGQIRMVTKSGGNKFSGSGSFFLPRRQAAGQHVDPQQKPERRSRTAARRRSTTSSTATRSAVRSMKDKLFFFARAGVGQLPRQARPNLRRCRPRRCGTATSASCCGPNNVFFSGRRSSAIRRPDSRSPTTSSRRTGSARTASRC